MRTMTAGEAIACLPDRPTLRAFELEHMELHWTQISRSDAVAMIQQRGCRVAGPNPRHLGCGLAIRGEEKLFIEHDEPALARLEATDATPKES